MLIKDLLSDSEIIIVEAVAKSTLKGIQIDKESFFNAKRDHRKFKGDLTRKIQGKKFSFPNSMTWSSQ